MKKFYGLLICFLMAGALILAGCARKAALPPSREKVVIHKVAGGETLEQIADDYYGDPKRALEIKRENALGDDRPVEGMVLQLVLKPKDLEFLKKRQIAKEPYNQGLELAARGAYLKAVGKFQESLAVDPNFADARYNLGVTYQKMKAYEKALVQLHEVVHLRPQGVHYHFALGNCYFYLERHGRAVEAFSKVISLNPEHLKARFSLAVALEKLGEKKQARDAWEKYLHLDSDSEWAREARKRLEELEP